MVVAIGGLSLAACQLRADLIAPGEVSLTTGSIQAYTSDNNTYKTLTILPSDVTDSVTESDGFGSGTTTGTFSPTGFAFSFVQSLRASDEVEGDGSFTFIAGADVSYVITDAPPSVSGGMSPNVVSPLDTTVHGDGVTYTYNTSLKDGNTELYGTGISSLTGTLTAGDVYTFSSSAQFYTPFYDPTLTYDPSITFYKSGVVATPENPAPMIPVLLGGLAFCGRRLRRVTSSRSKGRP